VKWISSWMTFCMSYDNEHVIYYFFLYGKSVISNFGEDGPYSPDVPKVAAIKRCFRLTCVFFFLFSNPPTQVVFIRVIKLQ